MRKLIICVIAAVVITACHTKKKSGSGVGDVVDTSHTVMPNSGTNNAPAQATFEVNRCFVNSSKTLTYFIDGVYCYYMSKICSYTYDEANNIVAIDYEGIWSDKKNNIYYHIETGYDVKNRGYQMGINVSEVERSYDLDGNINNPFYALVQMDKLSDGRYQLSSSGDRFSFYKPTSVNELLNDYSYVMDGLKATSNSYGQAFLITENKMNMIESKGAESVDAALNNKVDHTYNSLTATWNKISKAKDAIDSYVSSHQQVSNSQTYSPAMFTAVIANMERMKSIISENEQFNQTLDNEVLPLLQQSN